MMTSGGVANKHAECYIGNFKDSMMTAGICCKEQLYKLSPL